QDRKVPPRAVCAPSCRNASRRPRRAAAAMPGVCPMLRPPSARGASCARTLLAALEDVKLRPQVIHVGGVSEAELSMDFDVLAEGLPDGARIYLIGPDMAGASMGPGRPRHSQSQ
ncbi:unnamed protein product, partial [Prorocentrum cordatum]